MRSLNNSATQGINSSTIYASSVMSSNLVGNYQSNLNASQNQRLDWETLRKQARQLENEIDSKLVAFSKLTSSFSSSSFGRNSLTPQNSAQLTGAGPSNNSSSDLLFVTLSNEIEESLKKLNQINNRMSDSLNSDSADSSSSATVHTLQRHRDILRDYSTEYEKTKRNIISFKEREKLLSSSSTSNGARSNETNLNNRRLDNGGNPATSLYMKEYDHLKSSHNLVDQQLEIAELTKENLQSQRQSLRMIQQKMNTLAHKFPLINNLVQRIKLKKRKDTIILATVISICLIIMLLYIF